VAETWRPTAELEAEARVINAEPWEPMPGMVKRQCDWCRYFYAARVASLEPRCPDCVPRGHSAAGAHVVMHQDGGRV